eukprot:559700-Prymnesium_polylepis.1
MGLRLYLEGMTTRSKSGIRVRFGPKIAPPAAKLTPPASQRSHSRAEEREGERSRLSCAIDRFFARWKQDCERLL